MIDWLRGIKQFAISRLQKPSPRKYGDVELQFPDFSMWVNADDIGGAAYRDDIDILSSVSCRTLGSICASMDVSVYVDVGANYGFTALSFFLQNSKALCIAIEPNTKLIPYLERNLAQITRNGGRVRILNVMCGAVDADVAPFHINPGDTQDSRVHGEPGWVGVSVSSRSLTSILDAIPTTEGVFIKVDTQGYEQSILEGARRALQGRKNWAVKMEFAPFWIESQGGDPLEVLRLAMSLGAVFEWPKLSRFKGDGINQLLSSCLVDADIVRFTEWVRNRRANGRGWRDIGIVSGVDLFGSKNTDS